MFCSTVQDGTIRSGIQLWQDGPDKCFVHLRPDVWMPVRADLLNCADAAQIERVDGQIILHRASVQVIANHVMEFIPETPESAKVACVLAHIDNGIVQYTDTAPKPDFAFRSAMGLNFYARPIGSRRITLGSDGAKLACEEYSMVVGMEAGNYVNLKVMHYRADGDSHGQVDPWVEGNFLRFDGERVTYHQLEARPLSTRFAH